MKINKFLVTVILMLTIVLLFQNISFADEIVLSGYDIAGTSLLFALIVDFVVITVSFTLNFVNKKGYTATFIFIYIGIVLLFIYNYLYLDDEYRLYIFSNIKDFYLALMIFLLILTLIFHKNSKVFKIFLAISLFICVFTIPFDKVINYLTENDDYKTYFSGSETEFYSQIDEFNSDFMEYEGKNSYKKVKHLLGLLINNYYSYYGYGENYKIPFVNYISSEKTKYMITEFKEENVNYYASKRHKNKYKGNSMYYIYYNKSDDSEYLDFLAELNRYIVEGKNYNVEIQQMTCLEKYYGPREFDVVHVINIYEQ